MNRHVFPLSVLTIFSILLGCKKEKTQETPKVSVAITVSDITSTSATLNGEITSDGGYPITARGFCWSPDHAPSIYDSITKSGSGLGSFTYSLSGLSRATSYYINVYAINSLGTNYGTPSSFRTIPTLPLIYNLVQGPALISPTSALVTGEVIDNGGDKLTSVGICWSTNQSPTIADSFRIATSPSFFQFSLKNLVPSTKYYYRAFASNSVGTAYGTDKTFTTLVLNTGTITDIDGNIYKTVQIGNQWWMAENLRVTRYRNGDSIPNIVDRFLWDELTTGAYCYYNSNPTYNSTYGKLYNWFAVNDSRYIAPYGWHVPTDAEWTKLEGYLYTRYGFEAFHGGERLTADIYTGLNHFGYWWTSNIYDLLSANCIYYNFDYTNDFNDFDPIYATYGYKIYGLSVRCVKDSI
jgi:Fibrobacter succinogenes major domain (Fib_succ_major)